MKSIFKKVFAVIAVITIVTVSITSCASSNQSSKSAQSTASTSLDKPLKVDPSLKIGRLENGMTYYIKKNSEPQNRIYLRLALKAGSAMEEENERGVAHFIEHLAFNGTEHFQKSEIVDWFEKIGMNYGNDLNAYTNFEETVYMLEVPADDPEMLKTALLVLHDWASAVTFPQEEIDKERGVIQEEWRTRDLNVDGRMRNQVYPFMTKDSVFENRMPIGKMEVINNITRDEILAFYKKWYRPELMGVIVVGDAEVGTIEKEIKNAMSSIPASENPISVTLNKIPRSSEKQIKVISDPEFKYPIINLYSHIEKSGGLFTEEDVFDNIRIQFLSNIINLRLNEITNSADAKWYGASVGLDSFDYADTFPYLAIYPKDGMFTDAFKTLLDECDRIVTHGITEEELQMMLSAFQSSLQNLIDNKDKIPSGDRTSSLVYDFIVGDIPQGPEQSYETYKKLLGMITIENVNEYIKNCLSDRGTKMLVRIPASYDGLPSENELMDIWKNYKSDEISEYTNDSIDKLMDKPSKKGKIKSQSKNKELGTTEYVLENGVKIITKKTDFVNDEIIMQASSKGGTFQISDKDFPSSNVAVNYAYRSGFNGFTYNQLIKFGMDKNMSFSPSISYNSESISGSAIGKDLEYLFQLTNLWFSSRQYSDDAWKVISDDALDTAKKHGISPNDVYNDKINELIYGKDDLRHAPFDMKTFEKITPESAKNIVDERFANPADFTFVFVGDFDEKKLLDLCQTYLGTLTTTSDFEETKYLYWDFPKGKKIETVKKGIDDKGYVYIAFGDKLPPQDDVEESFKESMIATQLASLLDIRLLEVIREDNSGTYGVRSSGSIDGYPERYYRFSIQFGCEPKRCEELTETMLNTLKKIQANGVSDDNIQKLREQYRRTHETNLRNNWWWLDKINAVSVFTYQPDWVVSDTEKVCEWITSESLQEAAKKYLDTENYVCVFLKPE